MNRKDTLVKILRTLTPHRYLIIGFVIFDIINVLALLFIPYTIGKALDHIIAAGNVNFADLVTQIGILASLILANGLAKFASEACASVLSYRSGYDMRMKIFKVLNYAHIKEIDKLERGDTLSKIVSDVEQIGIGLTLNLPVLFSGILTVVGTIIFMVSINALVGLIVIALTPVSLLLAFALGKKSYAYHLKTAELRGAFTGKLEEALAYHSEVKSFNRQEAVQEQIDKVNNELYESGLMAQFLHAIGNPGTRFINNVIYAAIATFGGLMAAKGSLSLGMLVIFLTFASQYAKPFNEFTTIIADVQAALSSGKRVFSVMDKELMKESPFAVELEKSSGNISLQDVAFSYRADKKLLQDITFTVKSGDIVAIVGKTGSGKTTLINLLMRFYDIDSGNIVIDGHNFYSFKTNDIRKRIGMVLQDTWLFTGSVKENIAYGKPEATSEEIRAVCKLARCEGFIKRLSSSYDTVIGEGGKKLSKGQAQLIAIARVMLKEPDILILDEATSDIDTRTEIRIQEGFRKLMKDKTTFIVAHRLSTVRDANLILVVEDGNIIEQGTHKELLEKKGEYSKLYNLK